MSEDVDNFLAHYGVLGMHWGVQKKRDSNTGHKSAHRVHLEGKYIRKGMTPELAEKAANRRIKIEKRIAISGAVALTVVAAAVVTKKIGRDFTDVKLNSGAGLQHVTNLEGLTLDSDSPLFTAFRKNDKKDIHALYSRLYSVDLKAKNPIRAPSNYKARKMFSEVLGKSKVVSPSEYAKFNYSYFYNHDDPRAKEVVNQFFDKVQKAGYNSLLDPKPSGYRSPLGGVLRLNQPLIVFDGAKNLIKTGETKVTETLINSATADRTVRELAFGTAPKATLVGSFFAATITTSVSNHQEQDINKYIRLHPGTKLTRAQISARV